jgi:hypothetical protein
MRTSGAHPALPFGEENPVFVVELLAVDGGVTIAVHEAEIVAAFI